jgi:hypothetical protein
MCVCVGSGPPDRAFIVHHVTDKLFVQKYAIYDGQITPPAEEGTKQTQFLSLLFPYMADVNRLG